MAIKYNVIGVSRSTKFKENEQIYFVLKINNVWNVCGRANTSIETDINPFERPERYYTYLVNDIETCVPYPINDLCRDTFGTYWGLKFQRPAIIDDEKFVSEIEKQFHIIDKDSFNSLL